MPTYTVTRQDGYNSLMAAWEKQNTEIASLREQLAAMTEERDAWRVRAARDGAALAAVPVEAIRFFNLPYKEYRERLSRPGGLDYRSEMRRAVRTWLNAQPQEVQPSRAELDAAGIGETCAVCGYELEVGGNCVVCSGEVKPQEVRQ